MCDRRPGQHPAASVVVVAYRTGTALLACLDSLFAQAFAPFEVIVVDNGGNEVVLDRLAAYPLLLVRLAANRGPSHARNVGLGYARADIVCFLDDDAVADPRWLQAHVEAQAQAGVVAVRGKVVPARDSIYNRLAQGYDLGERAIPAAIDVEGNSSWKRAVLLAAGGFDEHLFGHEGSALSLRVVRMTHDPWGLVYAPDAIIYHDYSGGILPYLRKTIRHAWAWARLSTENPELYDFMWLYLAFRTPSAPPSGPPVDRLRLALLACLARNLSRVVHKLALVRRRPRSP